jgi:hypothetical protein
MKSRIAMAKVEFNKKGSLFTSIMDFELSKKQKQLESYEMWYWRRMEKISWTDHVRNEEILESRSREISYMK